MLSHDQFQVNPGSLFPSLYRLEQDGKLKAEWQADREQPAREMHCHLTAARKKQLEQRDARRWNRVSFAVASVLEGA